MNWIISLAAKIAMGIVYFFVVEKAYQSKLETKDIKTSSKLNNKKLINRVNEDLY